MRKNVCVCIDVLVYIHVGAKGSTKNVHVHICARIILILQVGSLSGLKGRCSPGKRRKLLLLRRSYM